MYTVSEADASKKGGVVKDKILRGSVALARIFADVAAKMTNNAEAVEMIEIRPLKQFIWMLSGKQQEEVKEWIGQLAKRYKLTAAGQLCITEKSADDLSMSIVASTSSSSSASASTDNPMLTHMPVTKKITKQVEKTVDNKAMMM